AQLWPGCVSGTVNRRVAKNFLHFAEYVETCLVAVAALHKRNLRTWNDQADGHVVLVVRAPEVERLQINGYVGRRQVAAHLLGERKLAVLGLLVLEVRG